MFSNLFYIYFLLLVTFFSGIIFTNRYSPPEYIAISDKIRVEVAKNLIKRHSMLVVGTRDGMIDCLNMVGLNFQIQGPLGKEILRSILIDSVEEFLKQINTDEKIRPFLKNFPFTEKEIEIVIFVKDKNDNELFDPDISVASAVNGKIYFNTVDKFNSRGPYKQWIEEDYQTAKAMILQKK